MQLTGSALFRLTRDAEVEIEDEADALSATWSASRFGSGVMSL
jgi:hypothetical protein